MITLEQHAFRNVTAGSTAILERVKDAGSLFALVLKLGGTFTKAQIDNLKIYVGTKKIWELTGSRLDTINQYMSRTANAAYLPIFFGNPNAKTDFGRRIGCVDMTMPQHRKISVQADINGAAVSPALSAEGYYLEPKKDLGKFNAFFKTMLTQPEAVSSGAKHALNVPMGVMPGAYLERLHLFHTAITSLEVKRDNQEYLEDTLIADMQFMQNNLNRTTQAGHLAYDPLFDNYQADQVPTARDDGSPAVFTFGATTSGADTIYQLPEVLNRLENI